MVHVHRAEKNKIYFQLLSDGVICVKKEFEGIHGETKVDNLKVWMVTRSLHSKGYLTLTYSWKHYYYALNQEGVAYIKKILGITEESVQHNTHKVRNEPQDERRGGRCRGRGRGNRRGGRGQGRERRERFNRD